MGWPKDYLRVNTDLQISVLATDIVLGWVRTKIYQNTLTMFLGKNAPWLVLGSLSPNSVLFFCCWRALDMYQKMLSIVNPHRNVSRQEQKIHDVFIHMCTHMCIYVCLYIYVCGCAVVCAFTFAVAAFV